MNFFKCSLILCFIFTNKLILAGEGIVIKDKLVNPCYKEFQNSAFNLKLYQGFGFRNVSWDLDFTYQFRQHFSIGIGNGIHRNKYPVYSSSDKHMVKMWSYPIYLTGNIFLVGNTERVFYVFGKYGRSFGFNTKNNNPTNDFKGLFVEGGFGCQFQKRNTNLFAEIGQHFVTSNGVYSSNYNSSISYNLSIYTVILRFGFRLKVFN